MPELFEVSQQIINPVSAKKVARDDLAHHLLPRGKFTQDVLSLGVSAPLLPILTIWSTSPGLVMSLLNFFPKRRQVPGFR